MELTSHFLFPHMPLELPELMSYKDVYRVSSMLKSLLLQGNIADIWARMFSFCPKSCYPLELKNWKVCQKKYCLHCGPFQNIIHHVAIMSSVIFTSNTDDYKPDEDNDDDDESCSSGVDEKELEDEVLHSEDETEDNNEKV